MQDVQCERSILQAQGSQVRAQERAMLKIIQVDLALDEGPALL